MTNYAMERGLEEQGIGFVRARAGRALAPFAFGTTEVKLEV